MIGKAKGQCYLKISRCSVIRRFFSYPKIKPNLSDYSEIMHVHALMEIKTGGG